MALGPSGGQGCDSVKMRRGCRIFDVMAHPVPISEGLRVDGRTTRHASYRESVRERPRVEKALASTKEEGG